jgi:hypothetical protein
MARRYKNSPIIEALEVQFEFTHEAERFLLKHDYLAAILSEAYKRIRPYFLTASLFLDVVIDPEVAGDNDTEQLVLTILTDLDVAEAMARLDRVDEEWWLGALPAARGKIAITLEFR